MHETQELMNGGRSEVLQVYGYISGEDNPEELILDHSFMILDFLFSKDHGHVGRGACFICTLAESSGIESKEPKSNEVCKYWQ